MPQRTSKNSEIEPKLSLINVETKCKTNLRRLVSFNYILIIIIFIKQYLTENSLEETRKCIVPHGVRCLYFWNVTIFRFITLMCEELKGNRRAIFYVMLVNIMISYLPLIAAIYCYYPTLISRMLTIFELFNWESMGSCHFGPQKIFWTVVLPLLAGANLTGLYQGLKLISVFAGFWDAYNETIQF